MVVLLSLLLGHTAVSDMRAIGCWFLLDLVEIMKPDGIGSTRTICQGT